MSRVLSNQTNDLVRVVGKVHVPWVFPCFTSFPDNTCLVPGVDVLLFWALIKQGLNVNVQFIDAGDEHPLEYLKDGRADTSFSMMGINNKTMFSAVRNNLIDISNAIVDDRTVFFYKRPKPGYAVANSLLFSLIGWPIFFVGGFTMLVVIGFHTKFPKRSAYAVTGFYLAITIVLGLYTNFLSIALFRHSEPSPPFKTFEELAEKIYQGECKVVSIADRFYGTLHPQNPNTESEIKLSKASQYNKPIYTDTEEETFKIVSESDDCLVTEGWFLQIEVVQAKFCILDVMIDEKEVLSHHFVYVHRKGWEYKDAVNGIVTQLDVAQFYMDITKQYAAFVLRWRASGSRAQIRVSLFSRFHPPLFSIAHKHPRQHSTLANNKNVKRICARDLENLGNKCDDPDHELIFRKLTTAQLNDILWFWGASAIIGIAACLCELIYHKFWGPNIATGTGW